MLISLVMKAGWQWIFSRTSNLGPKQCNGTDETKKGHFCNPRINESAKSRLGDMYVIVISSFHSILRQKAKAEGTYVLNLPPPLFDIVLRMVLFWNCLSKQLIFRLLLFLAHVAASSSVAFQVPLSNYVVSSLSSI